MELVSRGKVIIAVLLLPHLENRGEGIVGHAQFASNGYHLDL